MAHINYWMAYFAPYKIQQIPKVIIQFKHSNCSVLCLLIFMFSQLEVSNEDKFKLLQNVTSTAKKPWVLATVHYRLCLEGHFPICTFARALTLQNIKDPTASLRGNMQITQKVHGLLLASAHPYPTPALPRSLWIFRGNRWKFDTRKHFCIAYSLSLSIVKAEKPLQHHYMTRNEKL